MQCKKCGGENHVKAGFIRGEQRYLCKDCGCKFVPTRQHGKPQKDKLLAVWLYLHGLSFRTIAKLFKVTHKAVYDWVKAYAKENYVKPEPQGEAVVVELDEMWHYLHSKKDKYGFGRLIAAIPMDKIYQGNKSPCLFIKTLIYLLLNSLNAMTGLSKRWAKSDTEKAAIVCERLTGSNSRISPMSAFA